MTLRRFLIHRCTIQRVVQAGQDGYGEEAPVYSTTYPELTCRLITRTERLAASGIGRQILETYQLIVPAGVDVNTKDRISLVRLEDDATKGPFDVMAVMPRRDHRKQRLVALEVERVE